MPRTFTLTIDCDNDAFSPDEGDGIPEIARILRHVADKVESRRVHGGIMDINGSKVGEFDLTEED